MSSRSSVEEQCASNAKVVGSNPAGSTLKYTQDSREVEKGDIFIAFEGEDTDGHEYTGKALENGAQKIIFHNEYYKQLIPKAKQEFVLDTNIWLENTLKLKLHNKKIVSVCGSVGKTTTTKLLHHLVKNIKNRFQYSVYTPTFGINTLRGIGLDILNRYHGEDLLILETAMDSFLELDKMAEVLCPDYCCVVNIDISHFEKLKSMDRILRTEFGMLKSRNLEFFFINTDNKYIQDFINSEHGHLYDFFEQEIKKDFILASADGTCASSHIGLPRIKSPYKHLKANINSAIALLFTIDPDTKNINTDTLQQQINTFIPADKRFEIINIHGKCILNDCYNAAPLSYSAFFNYASEFKKRKLGIIGQINEIGVLGEKTHYDTAIKALELFDRVIFVGQEFLDIKSDITKIDNNRFDIFKDYQSALNFIYESVSLNQFDFFGIKGSRGVKLEHLFEYIKESIGVPGNQGV